MLVRNLLSILVSALLLQVTSSAVAQDVWPSRPVRMLIATPAGTGGDAALRLIAERMSQNLGQPIIVDNKVGANGLVANNELVRSRPDGYTILFGSAAATVVNQAMQPTVATDVLDKMIPVAQVGAGGIALVTTPDVPVSNVQELVRYAKSNPGKLDYATWGVGTSGHLIMEWLKRQYGLDIRHVPYKSMAQIYQEMMGGLVKIAFVDSASSAAHVRSGKIRALGTTGPNRAAVLPEVPTFMEQDVKFAVDGWYGFFLPKGTPDAIVNRLNQETLRVLADKSMEPRLRSVNIVNTPVKSPEEFTRTVANDLKVWQTIVRDNNIKPD